MSRILDSRGQVCRVNASCSDSDVEDKHSLLPLGAEVINGVSSQDERCCLLSAPVHERHASNSHGFASCCEKCKKHTLQTVTDEQIT